MQQRLAVIFDVDGVLVDSYQPHFQSWTDMFHEVGVDFDEAQFRGTFGRTNRDIFRELFAGEISDERARQLGDRKEELYRMALRKDFRPMNGVVELIDQLARAGFALAVGSSGPPENVSLSLEMLRRRKLFGAVVTGQDVERGKPDPQVFLKAAAGLGVPPDTCVVIEDAPQGIEAAVRAGMASVGVLGTTTAQELAAADLVVQDLSELSPVRLERLIAEATSRFRQ